MPRLSLLRALPLCLALVAIGGQAHAAPGGEPCALEAPAGGPGHHGGPGGPAGLPGDQPPPPPFLRGIDLTEAQKDKVFQILHAQAPVLRDKVLAARKAHEELRALSLSAAYDEGKLKALADKAVKAQGEVVLLIARGEHDVYVLLTPEQQKRVGELKDAGPGGRDKARAPR